MVHEQLNLFDFDTEEKYKIKKPIRLIELFAGYGSQALALKYLGAKFETWKTCEWAVKSIQAYKDIHHTTEVAKDENNFKLELDNILFKKGISADYNKPMTKEQIERLTPTKAQEIYNNIRINKNMVNIQQVHAEDLELKDTDKYTYIMTYSFPCQDLSPAGNGKGMQKGSGTRSGMLWEVERILEECNELGNLPEILLMENVPQVHAKKNVHDFYDWIHKLKELGYCSFYQDLNSKNYGIPQNRVRCFMVSILEKDCSYTFPKEMKLEIRLKDLLEKQVDEKYYLSESMIKYIVSNNEKWTGNNDKAIINRDIACTKTTRETSTRADTSDYICDDLEENTNIKKMFEEKANNKIIIDGILDIKGQDNIKRVYNPNGIGPTLTTMGGGNREPKISEIIEGVPIKNATKEGYLMAYPGDGIDISSRMETHRGTVQPGMAQTIKTSCDVGVIEEPEPQVKVVGNYMPSGHNASRIIDGGGYLSDNDGEPWNNSSGGYP